MNVDPFYKELEEPLRSLNIRIVITLMVVGIFHTGLVIPVPGITLSAGDLARLIEGYTLIEIHNHLIAGGGLYTGIGILSLGFLPYLQADAMLRFILLLVPAWKELFETPGSGERLWQWWSLILVIVFALFDAGSFMIWLDGTGAGKLEVLFSKSLTIAGLVAGAVVTLWLLRLADRRALAPGVALLSASNVTSVSLSGLVAEFPVQLMTTMSSMPQLITTVILFLLICCSIVFYSSTGRLVVKHATFPARRRFVQQSYIPLPMDHARSEAIVNASMMVGLITVMMNRFPVPGQGIIGMLEDPASAATLFLMLFLMAIFSLLYAVMNMDARDIADKLRKKAVFIPGVRPGRQTAVFLQSRILCLAVVGIVFKGLVFVAIWGLFRMGWLHTDPVIVMASLIVLINLGETAFSRFRAYIAMAATEGLIQRAERLKKPWWRWFLD